MNIKIINNTLCIIHTIKEIFMVYIFHTFLFLFSFLCISHSHYAQSPSQISTPAAITNNYYAPTSSSICTPQIQFDPNIKVENYSEMSVKISNITMQCIQKIKETITPENCQTFKNLILQILWHYRYTAACATLVGSYSIISLMLLVDYYNYLQNPNLWARWKTEYSFEQLCSAPQKELTQELLMAINEHNYNKNNPTDFTHPLIMFLTAIDEEIAICKRYISIAKTIKRLGLIKIFPTNDSKLHEINELLQRTLFIKHLFLFWLSDYNLNNNKTN